MHPAFVFISLVLTLSLFTVTGLIRPEFCFISIILIVLIFLIRYVDTHNQPKPPRFKDTIKPTHTNRVIKKPSTR